MSAKRSYAIILLGTSPGIVTELLWWLMIREQRQVIGAEVWTTGTDDPEWAGVTGYGVFQGALRERGGWKALEHSVGERAPELPQPAGFPTWPPPDAGPERGRLGIFLFGDRDNQLVDIRGPGDAQRVAAQLHDRVRTLRRTLPPDVELVGSLAGGRKTMSAALLGAFSLQARASDRLLHMLLEPRIEAATRGGRDFFAPSAALAERTDVATEAQVAAYEVEFPLVRELASGRALRAVLDEHPYQGIWPAVRANSLAAGTHTAVLRPEVADRVDRWILEIHRPDEAGPVCVIRGLTGGHAETYRAIVSQPGPATDEQWWAWLKALGERGKWSQGESWEKDGKDIARTRRSSLGKALSELTLEGLADFCVQSNGGRPARHSVPAGDRVHIVLPESDFYDR